MKSALWDFFRPVLQAILILIAAAVIVWWMTPIVAHLWKIGRFF